MPWAAQPTRDSHPPGAQANAPALCAHAGLLEDLGRRRAAARVYRRAAGADPGHVPTLFNAALLEETR